MQAYGNQFAFNTKKCSNCICHLNILTILKASSWNTCYLPKVQLVNIPPGCTWNHRNYRASIYVIPQYDISIAKNSGLPWASVWCCWRKTVLEFGKTSLKHPVLPLSGQPFIIYWSLLASISWFLNLYNMYFKRGELDRHFFAM